MACGALICAGAIIIATVKNKPKLEIAAKQVDEPKAITEVVARTPNLNNVHYEPSLEKDENGEFIQVPVPRGYVASGVDDERYVNGVTENGERVHSGGFVIYEGTELVTTDNLNEAQKTRNQYVWVPISSEEVSNMYHVENGQIYGNTYNFSSSEYSAVTSATAEPAVISTDMDQNNLKMYLEGMGRNEFLQQMREDFYNMLESVATYGGFYIGRYETGNITAKVPVVRKGNSATSNANWYSMYKACKNLKGTNKAVQTGMIWGIQWDATLKWLMDSSEKTYNDICTKNGNLSWGIYVNSPTIEYVDVNDETIKVRSSGSRTKIPTGMTEFTNANNIYDLAGNVNEWTMRGYYKNADENKPAGTTRASYGNFYYYKISKTVNTPSGYSSYYPSSPEIRRPDQQSSLFGCRAMLFVG